VARHAAIFAYTQEPGVIGRLRGETRQLFGRVLPEARSKRNANECAPTPSSTEVLTVGPTLRPRIGDGSS